MRLLTIVAILVTLTACSDSGSSSNSKDKGPTLQEQRINAADFGTSYPLASKESADVISFAQKNSTNLPKMVEKLRNLDKGLYTGDDARAKIVKHFASAEFTNSQVFQPLKPSSAKEVQFIVITGNDYSSYWGTAFQWYFQQWLNSEFNYMKAETVSMNLTAHKGLFSSGITDTQMESFKSFSGITNWNPDVVESDSVKRLYAITEEGEGYDMDVSDIYILPAVSYIMSQVQQGLPVVLVGLGQGEKVVHQLKLKFDDMEVDSVSYLTIGSALGANDINNILSDKDKNSSAYASLFDNSTPNVTSDATVEEVDLGPFLYLAGSAEQDSLRAEIQDIYDYIEYPELLLDKDVKFRATLYHDVFIRTGGYTLDVDLQGVGVSEFFNPITETERGPYVVETANQGSLPEGGYLLSADLIGRIGVRTFGLSVVCDSYVVNIGAKGRHSSPLATSEKLLRINKTNGERCKFSAP